MVHLKNIITGVLSGAVFFMAVQVGVAQEIAKASKDKMELSGSLEAKALAGTVEKLNKETDQKQVDTDAEKFEGVERALLDTYFEFTGTPGQDESDPQMWTPSTAGGCSGSNASCKILVKSAYVGASPTRILLSEIDVVDGSPGNQIPNSAQAGPNPSQPFISIHNQP